MVENPKGSFFGRFFFLQEASFSQDYANQYHDYHQDTQSDDAGGISIHCPGGR